MEMEMNAEMDRDDESESKNSKSAAGSSAGSVFCSLERNYAKLLHEMNNNELLTPYKSEYTRLFEALYRSHQEEEQLVEKLRISQENAIEKTSKILELEQQIKGQEETINNQNQEIVSKEKLADAAHTRESNAHGVIENLRLTINKLNHEIEQRNRKMSIDESGPDVQKHGDLLKDNERLKNETETLKQRIESMRVYTEELERKTVAYEEQVVKNQEQLDIQITEFSKEHTIREKIEKQLRELENELEIKNGQFQATNTSMKVTLANINELETTMKEQKSANDKLRKDVSRLTLSEMNLQTELHHMGKQIGKMKEILEEKNNEHKVLTSANKNLIREVAKYRTEKDNTLSKCSKIDNARANVEKNLKHTEHILKNVEAEMSSCQRQIAAEQRVTESAIRDKNMIFNTVESLKDTIKKMKQQMNLSERTNHKLQSDLEDSVEMNSVLNNRLQVIGMEKAKCFEQINSLTQQVKAYVTEVEHKDKEILDFKKELSSLKKKNQQQQNLFESMTSERNVCIKSLSGAQDEIQNLRDKIKLMNGQIEQVKEDATVKHNAIAKSDFWLKKMEQENEKTKLELVSAQKNVLQLRRIIEESKKIEIQLRETIKTTNNDGAYLKQEIKRIMTDRDILGTQLVRRNDELSLQYSKIKILHTTLSRGESEYTKQLEVIRLLKLEVNKLTTEKTLLIKKLENMSDLRHETYHLNRDLTKERLKVSALEEDLQNPINIHRWRKLRGSEPSTYELLKKIQLLQKRIITLSEQLISKSMKVNEAEKLYMDLRAIILKQPGPEFLSALTKTKKILQARDQMIKCLIAERNMQECRTNEESNKFDKISTDLRVMQEKYYALKRKAQKTSSQANTVCMLPTVSSSPKKYCGGGFTMLVSPSRNSWS